MAYQWAPPGLSLALNGCSLGPPSESFHPESVKSKNVYFNPLRQSQSKAKLWFRSPGATSCIMWH